jgi:hypothetical protein
MIYDYDENAKVTKARMIYNGTGFDDSARIQYQYTAKKSNTASESNFCEKVGATPANCKSLEASCSKPCAGWWPYHHLKWAALPGGCMNQRHCAGITGKFKDKDGLYHNGIGGQRFCMPKGSDECKGDDQYKNYGTERTDNWKQIPGQDGPHRVHPHPHIYTVNESQDAKGSDGKYDDNVMKYTSGKWDYQGSSQDILEKETCDPRDFALNLCEALDELDELEELVEHKGEKTPPLPGTLAAKGVIKCGNDNGEDQGMCPVAGDLVVSSKKNCKLPVKCEKYTAQEYAKCVRNACDKVKETPPCLNSNSNPRLPDKYCVMQCFTKADGDTSNAIKEWSECTTEISQSVSLKCGEVEDFVGELKSAVQLNKVKRDDEKNEIDRLRNEIQTQKGALAKAEEGIKESDANIGKLRELIVESKEQLEAQVSASFRQSTHMQQAMMLNIQHKKMSEEHAVCVDDAGGRGGQAADKADDEVAEATDNAIIKLRESQDNAFAAYQNTVVDLDRYYTSYSGRRDTSRKSTQGFLGILMHAQQEIQTIGEMEKDDSSASIHLERVCRNAVAQVVTVKEGEQVKQISKSIIYKKVTDELKNNLERLEKLNLTNTTNTDGRPGDLIEDLLKQVKLVQKSIGNRTKEYAGLNTDVTAAAAATKAAAEGLKKSQEVCLERETVLVEAVMQALEEIGCSCYLDEKVSVAKNFSFVQGKSYEQNKCSFAPNHRPSSDADPTCYSTCINSEEMVDFSAAKSCQNNDLHAKATEAKSKCDAAEKAEEDFENKIYECSQSMETKLQKIKDDDKAHIEKATEAFENIKKAVEDYDEQVGLDLGSVLVEINNQKGNARNKYDETCLAATAAARADVDRINNLRKEVQGKTAMTYNKATNKCHATYISSLEDAYFKKLKVVAQSDFKEASALKKAKKSSEITISSNKKKVAVQEKLRREQTAQKEQLKKDSAEAEKEVAARTQVSKYLEDAGAALEEASRYAEVFFVNCNPNHIPEQVRNHLQDASQSFFYINPDDDHNYIAQENGRNAKGKA